MRIIKFRAWDGMKMLYPEKAEDTTDKVTSASLLAAFNDGGLSSLMQFTGFFDRSKKEVYEGDNVRVYDVNRYCICSDWDGCDGEGDEGHDNHGIHEHESYGDCEMFVCEQTIKWEYHSGYFCDEDTGDGCPPLGADEIELEITGNIYQNPTLK